MLIYLTMASVTWFLVDWMVSARKEIWVVISAFFLTAIIGLATVFAIILFSSGTAPGTGLIAVLVAGVWSSIRSYRKPNKNLHKSTSTSLGTQDETFSYDDEEIKRRREQVKSTIIPKN